MMLMADCLIVSIFCRILGLCLFFLIFSIFFRFTAAIFWPVIMQNSQFFLKAEVCQNGNLIDYLLVSKAFNHNFGRAL